MSSDLSSYDHSKSRFDNRTLSEVLGRPTPEGGIITLSQPEQAKVKAQKARNVRVRQRMASELRDARSRKDMQRISDRYTGRVETGDTLREQYLKNKGKYALAVHEERLAKGKPGLGKYDLRAAKAAAEYGALTPEAAEAKKRQAKDPAQKDRDKRRNKLMRAFR